MGVALNVDCLHRQRVYDFLLRLRQPLHQPLIGVFVHKEADRAPVHSVYRTVEFPGPLEDLEHETVPAERHEDLGFGFGVVAVDCDKALAGPEGDFDVACKEAQFAW